MIFQQVVHSTWTGEADCHIRQAVDAVVVPVQRAPALFRRAGAVARQAQRVLVIGDGRPCRDTTDAMYNAHQEVGRNE